eukprot:scaffold264012_cov32-Tisochrysis_lutea.AAC.5
MAIAILMHASLQSRHIVLGGGGLRRPTCFSSDSASTPPPWAEAPRASPRVTGSVQRNRFRIIGPVVMTTSPVVKTARMTIAGSAASNLAISSASGVVTARGSIARRREGARSRSRPARMELPSPKVVPMASDPKTCDQLEAFGIVLCAQ